MDLDETLPPTDIYLLVGRFVFLGKKSTLLRWSSESQKEIFLSHPVEKLLLIHDHIYVLSFEGITVLSIELKILSSLPFSPKSGLQHIRKPGRQIITNALFAQDKIYLTSRSSRKYQFPIHDVEEEEILWVCQTELTQVTPLNLHWGTNLPESQLLSSNLLFYQIDGEMKVFNLRNELLFTYSFENCDPDFVELFLASNDKLLLRTDLKEMRSFNPQTREIKKTEIEEYFSSVYAQGPLFLGLGFHGLFAFYSKEYFGKKRTLKVKLSERAGLSKLDYSHESQNIYLFSKKKAPRFFNLNKFWERVKEFNALPEELLSIYERLKRGDEAGRFDNLDLFEKIAQLSLE